MSKNRAFSLLKSLNKSEVREFKKWLNSPVFNSREDVIRLFSYLASGNHLDDDKFQQKEWVFRKVYPEMSYSDQKYRQLLHFLTKQLEDYLAFKEFQVDQSQVELYQARAFRRKNLKKPFEQTIQKIAKKEQGQYRNPAHFLGDYLLEVEKEQAHLNNAQRSSLSFDQVQALDTFYLAERLAFIIHALGLSRVRKFDVDIEPMVQQTLQLVSEGNYLEEPAIRLYYYTIQTMVNPNDADHFHNLKSSLFQFSTELPKTEALHITNAALNYCIRQINRQNHIFIQEAFELYKSGFSNKIFIENNLLSPFTLINAIRMALQLKAFNWIEDTLVTFGPLLPEPQQEQTIDYCYARLYFEQGDYEKAMPILAQSDFKDPLLLLNVKQIQCMIYYNLDELELLDNLLESLRKRMPKLQIGDNYRTLYKNTFSLMRRLANLNIYDKKAKHKLREEIESTHPLPNKEWFLQQVA